MIYYYCRRQAGAYEPESNCKRDEISKAKGYKLRDTTDRVEREKKEPVKQKKEKPVSGPAINLYGKFILEIVNRSLNNVNPYIVSM